MADPGQLQGGISTGNNPTVPLDPNATTGASQFTSGSSQQSGTANTGTTFGGGQANTYTGGQQNLQGALTGQLSNQIQQGPPPADFIPQQMKAYTDYYNQYVAPVEAAQGGAGNPAIGGNLALGLEQLQANMALPVYQTQAGLFSNAEGTGAGVGFTPTGLNYTGNQSQNTSSNQSSNWQSNNNQAIGQFNALLGNLNALKNFLGGP
jgi:hypothetical protein